MDDSIAGKEFKFGILVAATVEVRAIDGITARADVERLLDGSADALANGPRGDLALTHLRLAAHPHLVAIDGVDPVAALEDAIRRLKRGGS